MRAVWIGIIQKHAGDEGFFIAQTWHGFAMEPGLHEPSEVSKTAPIATSRRRGCFSSGKPVVPIQHRQGLGDINFEIVTDSIGQTEWHDGLRQDWSLERAGQREHGTVSRTAQGVRRGLIALVRHGRRGVICHDGDERGHGGLVVTSYHRSRTEKSGQGLNTNSGRLIPIRRSPDDHHSAGASGACVCGD